tara:strand:+ start:675 stop:782 length:108 start_codon:yes stop_codon:yes gene_type:complete
MLRTINLGTPEKGTSKILKIAERTETSVLAPKANE